MKFLNLWKSLLIAVVTLALNTGAWAGGTNRDENTSATPGEKATTTTNPDDPNAHRGTNLNDTKKKSRSNSDKNRSNTNSPENTGTDGKSSTDTKTPNSQY